MTKRFTFLFIGLSLSFLSIQAQDWAQVGADILGEAASDRSGYSVSLSSDGSVVAIGAYHNGGNGNFSGHVRIYQNQSGTWTQIGSDIDGEATYDYSGYSVSLSSNGSIVAIGAWGNDGNGSSSGHVRIYQNLSGTWTQVGADINGEAAGDGSGWSVSLSSDGSVVAIGAIATNSNTGHVRIFQNISGTWTQVGNDIDGEAANDSFGISVSLNSNGSIVAIGASNNDGNGTDAGHVRIYQNISGTWTQIGADIDGTTADASCGYSVSLSSDGSIVAVGAINNGGNVRIYQNQSGTWSQIGSDINGFGTFVSLSSDGSIIAIGSPDANVVSGAVSIHQNHSGTWTQVGTNIEGEASSASGTSLSLSSDGKIVAIGAYRYNSYAGYTRIYRLLEPPVITSQPANQTNICPTSNASFTLAGTHITGYQWQVNTGSGFGNITNGGVYSNATTATLNITGVTLAMNNYQYRCVLSNDDGNTTSNSATLTTDNENPSITSTHKEQTVYADANCQTSLLDYTGNITATDNCDVSLAITQSPVAGTTISGATNTVTLRATDDAGNYSEVSFNVIVADNTKPVITSTHNEQTVSTNASCQASLPDYTSDIIATDNCDVSLAVTQSPVAGTTISGATNAVTLRVTDDAGNYSEVSFNVVVTDNTKPVITSTHSERTVNLDENCEASLPDYTSDIIASDNCDASLAITQSPVAGTTISGAINAVTLTVTDDAGNSSEVTFNVAVTDNTKPVIASTHNEQTVDAVSCEASLPDYTGDLTASDNCGANLDITQSPVAGTSISGATNTVTLTVTDDAGNYSEPKLSDSIL